jgi:hypothetical protein
MKAILSIWLIIVSLLVILVTGPVTTVKAQQGVELSEVAVITAKVVAIDRVDRHVTLRGLEGNDISIEVDHAARNFDQIQIGDQVKVAYYESVALYLGKPGQQPDAAAGMVVARSAKGEKPAGIAVEAVDVAATVQEIDKENRTVTLKGPHGKLVTLKVDKSVKGFESVMKGDSIHARYTEAIAISVEKP